MYQKIKIIYTFFLVLIFSLPAAALADTVFNLNVTPAVIDVSPCEKSQICLKKEIVIKNNSTGRADVYPQVNDLSSTTGIIAYSDINQLPVDASLTRWIDFKRSDIELMSGQTATETLIITASPHAVPGTYHALISFPPGNNINEAQTADQKLNQAKVQINMEIVEHTVEQAQIISFLPGNSLFTNNNIGFILKIKNIGNRPTAPSGEIIIYNKGGQDIASIQLTAVAIAPGETKVFSPQAKLNIGPGKFKAILSLNYGNDNGKSLNDVIYFSYLPLGLFIALLVFIFVVIFAASIHFHKKRKKKHSAEPETERPEPQQSVDLPASIHPKHHHKFIINLKK